MGEKKKRVFRLEFERELKPEFHGAKVTSDAGLVLYRPAWRAARERDEAFVERMQTMLGRKPKGVGQFVTGA